MNSNTQLPVHSTQCFKTSDVTMQHIVWRNTGSCTNGVPRNMKSSRYKQHEATQHSQTPLLRRTLCSTSQCSEEFRALTWNNCQCCAQVHSTYTGRAGRSVTAHLLAVNRNQHNTSTSSRIPQTILMMIMSVPS